MINELSEKEFFIAPPTNLPEIVSLDQQKEIYQQLMEKCFPFESFQKSFGQAYSRVTSHEREENEVEIEELKNYLGQKIVFHDEKINFIAIEKENGNKQFSINGLSREVTTKQAQWLLEEFKKPLDQPLSNPNDQVLLGFLSECFSKNIIFVNID
jgi:hypothetical protein